MPMKFIVSIFILVMSATADALTCTNYVPPNGEAIQIELDGGISYFTAPASLEGFDLQGVTLWAYPLKGGSGELVAPLEFEIINGSAKGHFAITAPFVKSEITAVYSQEQCGPRLEERVGT